jgi:hypothetical protein
MDPSVERHKLEQVKKALKAARKDTPLDHHAMFGEEGSGARKFQRAVLHELLTAGVLRKVKEAVGRMTAVYQMQDVELVDKLLDSEEELADLIWPSNRAPKIEELMQATTPPPEEAPQPDLFLVPVAPTPLPGTNNGPAPAPFQPGVAADPASIVRTNELLTELVEVTHNAYQSFIYVRDKMKEVEERLARIEGILKPLSGDEKP